MSDRDEGSAAATNTRFVVQAGDVGARLQQFLARQFSLSLSQTNRLLDRGLVQVDHWIAKRKHKGYKLTIRQVVQVQPFVEPGDQRAVEDAELAIDIIAADEERGWVVVNKPAGVPVHPLEPDEKGTVLSALIRKYPAMHGIGEGGLRSGVVHRLDVETSGTVVFATRQETWQRLRRAFAEHRTAKLYRAIVLGNLHGQGEEKMLLHIAQHRPALVRVVDPTISEADRPSGTRLCDLTWRVIESHRDATLIEVNLGTGFLHQIRAMFTHLAHPVAGDKVYRRAEVTDATNAPRLMLHASALRVEEVEARCDEPADFAAVLQALRLD